MYNPQTGTLILGDEIYGKTICQFPIYKSSMRQHRPFLQLTIFSWVDWHIEKAIFTGLSILPPPSSWNSSTEGLTHYKCSPDLKA